MILWVLFKFLWIISYKALGLERASEEEWLRKGVEKRRRESGMLRLSDEASNFWTREGSQSTTTVVVVVGVVVTVFEKCLRLY